MTTYAGLYGPEALIDGSGHPITSAVIDVFQHGTTTHVSLFQDNTRATPLANPVPNAVDGSTAGRGLDTFGNLSFYVDPGRYDLRIVTGAGTRTVEIEIEIDPAETASVPAPAGVVDAGKVVVVNAGGFGYELDPSVALAQSGQDPSPLGATARGTGTAAARYDHVHSSGGVFGWLGAGQDGAATFDGSATPAGTTKNSSTHYTLTRDVFYSSATISNGVTVDTSGFQMYVNGTLTGPGTGAATITAAPAAVSGTNQGTAALGSNNFGGVRAISLGTGTHGISGGTGAGGSEITYSASSAGRGGAGGAGASGAGGGAGGSHNDYAFGNTSVWKRFQVAIGPGLFHLLDAFMNNVNDVAYGIILFGGTGGAAGGGDGTNVGGAGGAGGNVVIVNAKAVVGIVNITAPGAAGGSPTTGNCGGGGGGGGGVALLNAVDLSGWAGTVSAAGGAGGTKVGTGVNGSAGSAGAAFATAWA